MHNLVLNRVIIIGSGVSLRQNLWETSIIDLPIWKAIKNEFTIGLNWSFKWFNSTVLMYSDYQFYDSEKSNLSNIPLILGKQDGAYSRKDGVRIDNNVILLKECERKKKIIWKENEIALHAHYWGKDAWTKGWYSSQLIGIKALNLAIALNCTEIFLLGFDACSDNLNRTHFYSDTEIGKYIWNGQKYSGVGKDKRGYYRTGNYNKIEELNKRWFQPFEEELKSGINIYNVSLNSKIETFPKISYDKFYDIIQKDKTVVNNDNIRQYIKDKLA